MTEDRRPAPLGPDDQALRASGTLARWLDERYLDPLIGLVLPGLGDLLTSAVGLYPIVLAWRRRAPEALLARMLLNLAADAAGGSIPVLGDVWDFYFKAHARNHELLRSRLDGREVRGHWSDTLVMVAAVLALIAALAMPVLVAIGAWHFLSAHTR